MKLGPAIHKRCPHCGALKPLMNLRSGNTFGGVQWSDTKSEYPMLPEISQVQRCTVCGKYYFLGDAKTIWPSKSISSEQNGMNVVTSSVSDDICFDTGELNFQEAKEALEQLRGSASPKREFTLRLYVLYAYNDLRGRKYCIFFEDEILRSIFVENVRAMLKSPYVRGTFKAELYREIGEFDKCIKTLGRLKPAQPFEQSVRTRIRARALKNDAAVFHL